MNNKKHHFRYSKAQWISMLESEIPGFDYQSTIKEIDRSICIEPINHPDDIKGLSGIVENDYEIIPRKLIYVPGGALDGNVFKNDALHGVEEINFLLSLISREEKNQNIGLCTLVVNPEKHFFYTIAKLRVLLVFTRKIAPENQVKIGLKLPTQNDVESLINYTTYSFAAKTAGVDFITTDDKVSVLKKLEAMCHVLNHETDLGVDVWKGSFLMEKLVTSITKEVNEAFKFPLFKHQEQQHDIEYSVAGEYPFLRGPYTGMYLIRPWTVRQYAGFSTAEESNAFYKSNLAQGQKGLSVAFDLPTHRGYDSDHPHVYGDVGKAGVAVDTVEDMKLLFKDIALDRVSVSMTMNGAVLPVMAFFIVAAQEQGVHQKDLRGTLQNDILKEFMVRNTYIYPPLPSMRIVKDIISYCAQHLPNFNPISISGYHMHEAGASTAQELAFTLADGVEYVKLCLEAGLKVDDFAPRLSFFWGTGMKFKDEVAKMRAGRVLWAELMQQFTPQNPKSGMLRVHCQTSGWSLIAQNPSNNIVRTTVEALAAISGHTQSLHTNALDEAIALPTPASAKIARDTQLYLQKEIGFTEVIDPFGGSEEIEKRTVELIEEARSILTQIDAMGGMTLAIKKRYPQSLIERNAAARQASIDAGEEIIVGLNKYQFEEKEKLNILEVDNEQVKQAQVERLEKIKTQRDNGEVKTLLAQIEKAAKGNANLLALCIKAAKARVTLGEISLALEKVFGRHQAVTQIRKGMYARAFNNDKVEVVRKLTKEFRKRDGRQPRILIAKMGQDGHDRGAKVIASAFADMGFDVDLAPLFQTPSQVVKQAIENDVHIIGISSLAGGHKALVSELMQTLKGQGLEDVIVIVGGIIPDNDHNLLKDIGVSFVFGPGTDITKAAEQLLNKMLS